MNDPIRRKLLSWGITILLLAGGVSLLALAWRSATARHLVAAVDLPPDGSEQSLQVLHFGNRYDHQVVLHGTFQGRFNGVTYDALYAQSPDQAPRLHNLLELSPATLTLLPSTCSGEYRFQMGGQENLITARLDPDSVADDMLLPAEERGQAFEGGLHLEVWERDRLWQVVTSGLLTLPGVLALLVGSLRLRQR